uniref:Uncharacterized protein n=1 Tax=Amphimedon queenslandica TaxID=400682 RepID=A0A1X7TUI3_AMPQE
MMKQQMKQSHQGKQQQKDEAEEPDGTAEHECSQPTDAEKKGKDNEKKKGKDNEGKKGKENEAVEEKKEKYDRKDRRKMKEMGLEAVEVASVEEEVAVEEEVVIEVEATMGGTNANAAPTGIMLTTTIIAIINYLYLILYT